MGSVITGDSLEGQRARVSIRQGLFIVLIGAAITVCEYVFAYQNVPYGIAIGLGLATTIYIVLSVWHLDRRITTCAESLALIPLYILFTSSLPWFFIDQQYLLPAVYSCILGLCFWHIYRHNLSLKNIINFKKENFLKYMLIGIVVGAPLGFAEYLVLHPAPAFPSFEVKYLFRDVIYMFLFVGLAEEILFRGLIQQDLQRAFGWKWAILGASIMFAVMHLTWRSVPELIFVFLASFVLGGLYMKTKSLVPAIAAHGMNNVMLVAILPYVLGIS